MAANLATMENGQVAMMAWGRIPVWHGTGQRVGELVPVERAYELSGVNYPVVTVPNEYRVDGEVRPGVGVQIVRADTWEALAQASEYYRPIQNSTAFELAGKFIGQGLAGVMTAGVIGGGQKAWMQFVLGQIGVSKLDRGVATLLVSNDHTGDGACTFGFTTVWVVCANTEAAAQRQLDHSGNVQRVFHIGDTQKALKQVQQPIDLANAKFKSWEEIAAELTKVETDAKAMWRLAIAAVMPPDKTIEGWRERPDASKTYWKNLYTAIAREYYDAPGQDIDTRRGTAWGAFQAVTSWVDFKRAATKPADQRVKQMWFGPGAEIKERALTATLDHLRDAQPWPEQVLEVEQLVG